MSKSIKSIQIRGIRVTSLRKREFLRVFEVRETVVDFKIRKECHFGRIHLLKATI